MATKWLLRRYEDGKMTLKNNSIFISAGLHILALWFISKPAKLEKAKKSHSISVKILDKKQAQDQMIMTRQTPTAPPLNEAAESWQDHKAIKHQKPRSVPQKSSERNLEKMIAKVKSKSSLSRKPVEENKESALGKGNTETGVASNISQRNLYEKLLGQSSKDLMNQMAAGGESFSDPGDGDRLDLDTKEYRYMGYFSGMRKSIELVWAYPSEAARRGIQGTVAIEFTIEKTGAVKKIKVARSSGSKSLDDAIVSAIQDAQPFAPLPKGFGKDKITVSGNFNYVLTGYAVSH